MTPCLVKAVPFLKGIVVPPGDKSIAHRAVILGSLTQGRTCLRNFPVNNDCLSTIQVFRRLGVTIQVSASGEVIVFGKGLHGFKRPGSPFFISESGTTFRLVAGVLAGQDFSATLKAGRMLSKRPMRRIIEPLRLMGAHIVARKKPGSSDEFAPLAIRGGRLKPLCYRLPVASAQVKSALLIAGLYAPGKTKIFEPVKTRDHTERMLKLFGADVTRGVSWAAVTAKNELSSPGTMYVAGDISSASFFLVAGSIMQNARVTVKNVSLNPGRIGVVTVLKRMGADLRIKVKHKDGRSFSKEPLGDIVVSASRLRATFVGAKEVPSLIDELPILFVAACFAEGKTVFQGVGELRVKETDRIRSMTENLSRMGARIFLRKRGNREDVVIEGPSELKGSTVKSYADHRTAMSTIIAGLRAQGVTRLDDVSCIDKSFPDFLRVIRRLTKSPGCIKLT